MRQSLSEKPGSPAAATGGRRSGGYAVAAAMALSIVLAAAAIADQVGGRTLVDHAAAVYASSGEQPSAGLLYGLVYSVAAIDTLLWLPALRAARSHRRSAPVLAVTGIVVSAGLAVLLLVSSEYGERIFPPLWGVLAILPAVAGVVAIAFLLRRA
jgi:hypothetical protein